MNVLISDDLASRQYGVATTTYERVLAAHPQRLHVASFMIGGYRIQTRIIGIDLAKHILLPFLHLQVQENNTKPHLTIDLWDENDTHIRRKPEATIGQGEWYAYTETSPRNRYFSQRSPNTFACLDRKSNRVIGSIDWSNRIFIYERAKPLARILLEWLNDQSIQVVHGGMVAVHGRGVLFVGKSGSGKSTAALSCACAGLDFLAEDYVALEHAPDHVYVGHSMFNSVFLEKGHLEKFPNMKPFALSSEHPQEKKSGFILAEVFSDRLKQSAPITALVVVRVANTVKARISTASKAETLLALGPSSLFQIPSRGKTALTTLIELTTNVPAYRLDIGEDLTSVRGPIEKLVSSIGGRTSI